MRTTFSLIGGASLGAALMFFIDPDRGGRRRALIRDKGLRLSRKTRDFASSASRDAGNRALGMGAALKSWVQPAPPVPDYILAQRARAKLGLYSRHPSAIDVHATDGAVTLSGPVLEDEVNDICTAMSRIRGVKQVFNRMEAHRSPEDVPALQGTIGAKRGPRFAFMQSHWSPTARTAAALMGAGALLYGVSRRTVGAATLAATGLGLLVRSATNEEFARFFHMRLGSFAGV
jgi:hypothetical protein